MDELSTMTQTAQTVEPLFDPTFINLGYIYNFLLTALTDLLRWLLDYLLLVGPLESPLVRLILWLIGLAFLAGIIYLAILYRTIRKTEDEKYEEILDATAEVAVEEARNRRWVQVQKHMDSMNEADWRLAILEADNILEEMLESLQLPGESVGEKMRNVEASDFTTIQSAWEAHKVRNKVAHEGASFALSRREADRVIALYKEVFQEFHYI